METLHDLPGCVAFKLRGVPGPDAPIGPSYKAAMERIAAIEHGNAIMARVPISQAFYCTSEARAPAEQGAGLGLPIARSIILAQGETIQVESCLGQGSFFRASIPIVSQVTSPGTAAKSR